jgi:hypothetical protein
MATTLTTEYSTINVAPTTLFQANSNTSYIIAKVLLKNEKSEPAKVTIKLNNLEIVKNLVLPIFNQEPIEINSISKLKLVGTDKLEITIIPNSMSETPSFGLIGGFPWYTTVEPNVATIIMTYVKQTI